MYHFLDHPSEALVEIQASSVEEVFCDAAKALFEVMTDTTAIRKDMVFPIRLRSGERNLLLIEWLNRLILIHEVESVFLAHFEITVLAAPAWQLEALAGGERISENQEKRSHVKSATYGSFEWTERSDGHIVRFVLDV